MLFSLTGQRLNEAGKAFILPCSGVISIHLVIKQFLLSLAMKRLTCGPLDTVVHATC